MISNNGRDSPLCKYCISLSTEWAVHEAILVGITEVVWVDKAMSTSNLSAVLVWLSTVLGEVPHCKAKLANVLSSSNVPHKGVVGGVASSNFTVAARGKHGFYNFNVGRVE